MSPRSLHRSHTRTCPYKIKLDVNNAQEYLLAAQHDASRYKNPEDLNLYLCTACGYLHIGHVLGTKGERK